MERLKTMKTESGPNSSSSKASREADYRIAGAL
jgi:hypothetical protein